LKVDVKQLPGSKRELKVEVPPEGFQEQLEAAYKDYRTTARVPGFRAGKVPMRLLKRRYGQAIRQSVFNKIIPDLYKEALDSEKLVPVSDPEITLEDYEEGQPLVFTASVEVSPQIAVTGYEGLEVVRTVYEVTNADVEEQIQRLRVQHAEERSVDRPAQRGDFLLADMQELDRTLVPLVGQKTENALIELGGANSPAPEFDQQLEGISPREERRVTFTYKDDYPDARLAQQTRSLAVTVKEVKERILPKLDDEFAKDLQYDDLDDLKAKVREGLEAQSAYLSLQGLRAEIMNRLIAANPFQVPESMVARYVERTLGDATRANISPERLAEFRNKIRDQAVESIKSYIILQSIAEAEGLEVTQEDVDRKVNELAEANDMGVNEVKRSLTKDNRLEKLKESLLDDKVWEFLIQRVRIKDAPPARLWVSRQGAEAAGGGTR